MRLKVLKRWNSAGDTILEVHDKDAELVAPLRGWGNPAHTRRVIMTLQFKRGTPREDVQRAKQNLLMMAELKLENRA